MRLRSLVVVAVAALAGCGGGAATGSIPAGGGAGGSSGGSGGATGGSSGSAGAPGVGGAPTTGAGGATATGAGGAGGAGGISTTGAGGVGGSTAGIADAGADTAVGSNRDAGTVVGRGDGSSDSGSGGGGSRDAGVGLPNVGPNPDPAARLRCTGSDPISCHLGGAPGNYDVTVVLGGATAGNTIVEAERLRPMLGAVATSSGQTLRYTFTVNVRQPEGEPIQPVEAGTPGLDLYFLGNAGAPPLLSGLGFATATAPFLIYVAGDSTVCDQPTLDYGGWGQQLPQFFNYPVSIANYADSGESSGSFLHSASLFGAITSRLKASDWVLIQFGHNDKDVTEADFHDNMTALVTGVKAKGGFPVLVTPVARAQFNGNVVAPQHINSTGANLPEIVRQVATEQNVPVLDMTARTVQWLTELGPTGWQQYHALGTDVTHTNPAGAFVEAGFIRDLIRQANLTPLITRLR